MKRIPDPYPCTGHTITNLMIFEPYKDHRHIEIHIEFYVLTLCFLLCGYVVQVFQVR
jgi:hypothetical protein